MIEAIVIAASAVGVGACVVGGVCYRYLYLPVAHIRLGRQRRALYPIDTPIGTGASMVLSDKEIDVQRKFFTLKNGEQIFYQVMTPVGRRPARIFVFFHGIAFHSDMLLESMSVIVKAGAMVVMMDLPHHGRSDGLLVYIPSWWDFMNKIWEWLDGVVVPLRNTTGTVDKPLRLFAGGMSLGGGIATCLAVQRPTFFDGLVLICPMLFVSDELKPPLIVQNIFRCLFGPWRLTWPLAPSKDMAEFDFRIPAQGRRMDERNVLGMQGLKPRLATAMELAFTFPEWMEQNLAGVRVPLLALHGKPDKITDPALTERLVKEASSTDKTLKLFDGAEHAEMLECMPGLGKYYDLEWLPEQRAVTEMTLRETNEWMTARS